MDLQSAHFLITPFGACAPQKAQDLYTMSGISASATAVGSIWEGTAWANALENESALHKTIIAPGAA